MTLTFDLFDLQTANVKFATLVTPVQRYVSTELEVPTAFWFRENRMHWTDGRTDRHTDA